MVKALVLLSGGLDSMLAAKVLMEQGIKVTGLSFKSCFFGTVKAKKAAEQLGIKLIEYDFSDEHLAMVKKPAHGYGKHMNPCIDCHALMLKKAREIMTQPHPIPLLRKERAHKSPLTPLNKGGSKFDFIATGEVLGERPMSQNPEALKIVEEISGLTGKLVRPLSAKLLAETEVEKEGLVKRNHLLDISGRSRKRQLELVKKYGIKEYASPGGGCLLTDPAFSEKLVKTLEYWPDAKGADIELLKLGRIIWLTLNAGSRGLKQTDAGIMSRALLIIGRDEKDNEKLSQLAQTGDVLIDLAEEAGPTSLARIKKYPSRPPSRANGEAGQGEAEAGELKITNETQEIDVPLKLKTAELKISEAKNPAELIKVASLLTGYYSTKARGKKIKISRKVI